MERQAFHMVKLVLEALALLQWWKKWSDPKANGELRRGSVFLRKGDGVCGGRTKRVAPVERKVM
jgi:hypothetical protein